MQKYKLKFSVITPTFNSVRSIERTIESLQSQSFSHWELLIVDDGSIDGTVDLVNHIINNDDRICFFERPSEKMKGANACRNIGIDYAKGEYLIFLDSDDHLPINFLQDRIELIEQNIEFDLLISSSNKIVEEEVNDSSKHKQRQEYYLKNFLAFRFPWKITEVMWRKEKLGDLRFDENLQRFQDIDFHINILLNKPLRIIKDYGISNFYRDKNFDKYENREFINRVLNSYDYLYKKYIEVLSPDLKNSLKESNRILIKFILKLENIDKDLFVSWLNKILEDNKYDTKPKLILRGSYLIRRSFPFLAPALKEKIINKILTYS